MNLAADGPHPFGQIPPEKQLAIDAQLDFVVAAGEKLDRLRARDVEKSAPARAEVLAGQAGLLVEESQIDFVRARIHRRAAECQLRENRTDQSGLGRQPFDDRRQKQTRAPRSPRRWRCRWSGAMS